MDPVEMKLEGPGLILEMSVQLQLVGSEKDLPWALKIKMMGSMNVSNEVH